MNFSAWLAANMNTLMLWIGALCTLGLYSILYKENRIYRFFEHAFLGIATGNLVSLVWIDVLHPKWWQPMTEGGYWQYILCLVFGLYYYFVFSKRNGWMARLVIGFFLGVTAGQTFQAFVNDYWPQIPASFKPIIPHGAYTVNGTTVPALSAWEAFNNIIFMVILVCVMSYFFFSFEQKNRVVRSTAQMGRYMMMFTFGAIFGSTVMGRLSLLIDRMDFLINDFGGTIGGPNTGPKVMFAVLLGLIGLVLYLAMRPGARENEEA